jgi:hypothetical protein
VPFGKNPIYVFGQWQVNVTDVNWSKGYGQLQFPLVNMRTPITIAYYQMSAGRVVASAVVKFLDQDNEVTQLHLALTHSQYEMRVQFVNNDASTPFVYVQVRNSRLSFSAPSVASLNRVFFWHLFRSSVVSLNRRFFFGRKSKTTFRPVRLVRSTVRFSRTPTATSAMRLPKCLLVGSLRECCTTC